MSKKPPKNKKPRKRLTLKQKAFADNYIKTKNGTKSALKVYNTTDNLTARVISSENLTKPNIQNYIASVLDDDLLETKHKALLNKKDENGEIDTQAVKAGLDMAYKVKGYYKDDTSKITNNTLNIYSNKSDEELLQLLKDE